MILEPYPLKKSLVINPRIVSVSVLAFVSVFVSDSGSSCSLRPARGGACTVCLIYIFGPLANG
jgi:hypothetical protein